MKHVRSYRLVVWIFLTILWTDISGQGTDKNLWQPYRITPREGSQHIDLAGAWELSYMDSPVTTLGALSQRKDPFQTTVPNSIHWSLFKAGKLPHPYAHKNSTQYRWVEEKAWYYKKEVEIPASSSKDNIFLLSFDGIDYFSRIWVSDTLAGVHEGMLGGPVIDITRLVIPGKRITIVVEVRAANWGNRATNFEDLPRTASGERDYSKRTGYNPRASGNIIKPWVLSGGSGTEAFFTVGMWQGARIDIVPAFHVERPFLTTTKMTADEATIHLSCELFTEKNSLDVRLHPWNNTQIHHPNEKGITYSPIAENLTAVVEFVHDGKVSYAKEIPLNLYKGRNWIEQDLTIKNPRIWNPVGLGEPHLYDVNISLKKDNTVIDKISFPYGIRIVERIATAGPRTFDRWEDWQFVVNGKKIFVKGMNWTPADVLLDLPEVRYRWALEAAKDMGVQLIRVWGGGLLETDHFYNVCNELGIMVWQDFPIGNQDTPDYPQDVWEAQVVQNIFRLRNHPSLVVWCGGNEFNPYSYGNATSIGILERNLRIFDNTRLFVRTTPDDGSIHIYPDMDPTWYNRSYKNEAWVSETGMHSIPEPGLFYELVDNKEFNGLGKMWDVKFPDTHPEFIHHFTEYGPGRVPRMLSRASHIDNMADPSLESISEASQIGAGEWYQIVSEKMQGNYPVTTGLMPWVFKRHWPVIAIQMMDWFGQAAAPYYFLKRTYEPTHIMVDLPRLLWRADETIALDIKVTNAGEKIANAKVAITVMDETFRQVWKEEKDLDVQAGTSVSSASLPGYHIPGDYKDKFLFVVAELHDGSGEIVSRSVYSPRVLTLLEDEAFYAKYVSEPVAWVTLDKGPWLKPSVAKSSTSLEVKMQSNQPTKTDQSFITVIVKNTGKLPAFMTRIDIVGTKRVFFASDNYFWLSPGEAREISIHVQWREPANRKLAKLSVSSWNAKSKAVFFK